jgi:hypothetical protein
MGGSSAPPPAPIQASYSEALADSLRAQVDLLRGTGDFEDTGGLAELLRDYEAPVRQQTAQMDTDVLRQTLLGAEGKETEISGTYDSEGRLVIGQRPGVHLVAR